ncbi:MAG: hypothetical protein LBN35_01090 [Clostridiales Family XIII bacterium]|jgi:uncharacterized membrane protein|nr:hypothetical protein [Clostridiales Family XIII bacterium]
MNSDSGTGFSGAVSKNRKRILWITRTAVFIAVLVVAQLATAPLGNTLVTGSLVNLILIVAVMTNGPSSGLTVAVLSPVLAKLVNIGPFWTIIPFIIIGNVVLVLVWHLIGGTEKPNKYASWVISLVVAAGLKFVVIYIGVVKLAIPVIIGLPEPKAQIMSAAFSVPQLITATVGGVIAIIILPVLKKAIRT